MKSRPHAVSTSSMWPRCFRCRQRRRPRDGPKFYLGTWLKKQSATSGSAPRKLRGKDAGSAGSAAGPWLDRPQNHPGGLDGSLKRADRHIDRYQIHCPDRYLPLSETRFMTRSKNEQRLPSRNNWKSATWDYPTNLRGGSRVHARRPRKKPALDGLDSERLQPAEPEFRDGIVRSHASRRYPVATARLSLGICRQSI